MRFRASCALGSALAFSDGSTTIDSMSRSEHVHAPATPDDLAQLAGAATPHFALQIRDRIRDAVDRLDADDPARGRLLLEVDRLDRLAVRGESGGQAKPDLPARAPLELRGG